MASIKTYGLTITVKYLVSNNGLPYYQRSVPKALQGRLGKRIIKVRLNHSDSVSNATVIAQLARRHDALFKALLADQALVPSEEKLAAIALLAAYGLKEGDQVGGWSDELVDAIVERDRDGTITPVERTALNALKAPLPDLLSEVPGIYLETKGITDKKTMERIHREFDHLIDLVGDIAAAGLQRQHANQYRDARLQAGLRTNSVRRELNDLRAAYNIYLREKNLSLRNQFEGLAIQNEGNDASKKVVLNAQQLGSLLKAASQQNDDMRRLVVIQACTGARIAEVAGLRRSDVVLDAEIPYIVFTEYGGRTLKTGNSKRTVPLVGPALTAAKEQLEDDNQGIALFPRYCNGESVNSNSASAAINKWIKKVVDLPVTSHCLRHTMRDLLRYANVPKPVIDEIGGWSQQSIGDYYGDGYAMKQKQQALTAALAAVVD